MAHEQDVLTPHDYGVTYIEREGFKGRGKPTRICIASRGGRDYYARSFSGFSYDRLRSVQDRIPYIARIADVVEDVVVFETAPGQMLWEIDPSPDPNLIEQQLMECAIAAASAGVLHGDLRPWNVFFDELKGVSVIDWSHGGFFDELKVGRFRHLISCKHEDWPLRDVDRKDAERVGRVLRGADGLHSAWDYGINAPDFKGRPSWCRP